MFLENSMFRRHETFITYKQIKFHKISEQYLERTSLIFFACQYTVSPKFANLISTWDQSSAITN